MRLDGEVGYGLRAFRGRGLLTLAGGFSLQGRGQLRHTVGALVDTGSLRLKAGVERVDALRGSEYGLSLRGEWRPGHDGGALGAGGLGLGADGGHTPGDGHGPHGGDPDHAPGGLGFGPGHGPGYGHGDFGFDPRMGLRDGACLDPLGCRSMPPNDPS